MGRLLFLFLALPALVAPACAEWRADIVPATGPTIAIETLGKEALAAGSAALLLQGEAGVVEAGEEGVSFVRITVVAACLKNRTST